MWAEDGAGAFVDAATGKTLGGTDDLPRGAHARVVGPGRVRLVPTGGGPIVVVDAATDERISFGNGTALEVLKDGRILTIAGHVVSVFSTSGEPLARLDGHAFAVRAMCETAGMVVTTSDDQTIRVTSLQTFETLRVLVGHTGDVLGCVAIDSNLLISWANDRTVRTWSLETGKQEALFMTDQPNVGGVIPLQLR